MFDSGTARRAPLWLKSMLVGVLVGAVFYGAVSTLRRPEWESHQRLYNALLAERGRGAVPIGIRSNSPQRGSASPEELCVTCHLGTVVEPATGDHPLFERHPEVSCSVPLTQTGCSACHGRTTGLALFRQFQGLPAIACQQPLALCGGFA